ncbi:tail fiber protein, partial [Heyndrickxia oleronia]|uniref:tail fiber protein n=1 Tax=Heyndrickxia oleronia TaxID=38875 RepID=UPI00203DA264
MAENFSFFDPVEVEPGVWDREYFAQQFTDYFRRLVTTGVMKGESGELKVSTEGNSMITTLSTGVAYVVGRSYENTSPLTHTHDTEVLGKNRIDRIVVRLDLRTESRFVKSFIKKGVASTSPVPPDLQRDQFIYEISLAQVKVIGGQTYINANDVIDERGKTDICPWAGSKILPNFDNATLEAHIHDYKEHIPFAVTTGTSTEYQIILDDVTELYDGLAVAIRIHTLNAASAKLKINNFISKSIVYPNKFTVSAGDLPLGSIFTLRYSKLTDNFIIQGGASIKDATTTEKGIVKLNDSLSSTSTTEAATPNAVKQAYDKGNSAYNQLNGLSVKIGSGGNLSSYGVAIGNNVFANGSNAAAVGRASNASGNESVALGFNAMASSSY